MRSLGARRRAPSFVRLPQGRSLRSRPKRRVPKTRRTAARHEATRTAVLSGAATSSLMIPCSAVVGALTTRIEAEDVQGVRVARALERAGGASAGFADDARPKRKRPSIALRDPNNPRSRQTLPEEH